MIRFEADRVDGFTVWTIGLGPLVVFAVWGPRDGELRRGCGVLAGPIAWSMFLDPDA